MGFMYIQNTHIQNTHIFRIGQDFPFIQVLSWLPCHWAAQVLHPRIFLHRPLGEHPRSRDDDYNHDDDDRLTSS